MSAQTMGQRLLLLRKNSDLNQEEIAKIVGVSAPTLSGYEHNRRTPSIDKLNKLAELYGVSLDYLISGKIQDNDIFESPVKNLAKTTDEIAFEIPVYPTSRKLSYIITELQQMPVQVQNDIADVIELLLRQRKNN